MRRALTMLVLFFGATALAQDDTPDAASIPDASVGQGGADLSSPEFDETSTTTCVGDGDCDLGFACDKGRCVYRRVRDATYLGCSCSSPGAALVPLGAWALARRRRYLVKRTK